MVQRKFLKIYILSPGRERTTHKSEVKKTRADGHTNARMNAQESISWLSETTKISFSSYAELKSCAVLLALCEILLDENSNLRKLRESAATPVSDSVLLHVALDELRIGGEYVKAVLEGDALGILEVIQKLKEKYDLRVEIEDMSRNFLRAAAEEEEVEEVEEVDVDDDDDNVFGTRDGDALDELDDLGFDLASPSAKVSSRDPNVSSPVKFINASSLLDGEKSFEMSPPFKSSNANNITRRRDGEDDKETVAMFERKSPIQRAPSFTRWNKSTEEENEEENEENQLLSVAKVRRSPEPLAWFSPLNPEEAALSKAETNLSVAEIALLRRGKALSSSLSSGKKKREEASSPYFTTKSAEASRPASSKSPASPSPSSSKTPPTMIIGKRTNASEVKIALKFGALAGESDQMKRLRSEALQALETENVPGAKHQFLILFSETSENSKTYRGLYKLSSGTESTDGITLRKIHSTSEKVPDSVPASRVSKTLKYNLASKMWHELHDGSIDANAMAFVLRPKKK